MAVPNSTSTTPPLRCDHVVTAPVNRSREEASTGCSSLISTNR